MYPLKFKPILKSTLWGGERIIPFKQLDCQQEQVGESWEISDVPGDESVVAEGADAGKNLTQLMEEYKGKLVGEENYKRFQGKFPLLIKFIDAKQDLSIQVHPDDELAMKRHQSMGKNRNVVYHRQYWRRSTLVLWSEKTDYSAGICRHD